MPVSPGGDTGAGGPTAERFQDAFDEWVATWLVGRAWEGSTKVWVTPVRDEVASPAEGLSGFQHEWHYLVVGNQGESVGQQMSLELASNDVLAGIATELALPGVASINSIKRIVQFAGIIIGVVAGEPLLAKACLKWLAHDLLVEAVSKEIGDFLDFLTSTLELAGTRERDLKDPEVEREISRQVDELKEQLETERQCQEEGVEFDSLGSTTAPSDGRDEEESPPLYGDPGRGSSDASNYHPTELPCMGTNTAAGPGLHGSDESDYRAEVPPPLDSEIVAGWGLDGSDESTNKDDRSHD